MKRKTIKTNKKIEKKRKSRMFFGFTLIELLAVIIILGILLLVAIPSVSSYINNSRRESYITTARNYIKGAVNLVNSGQLDVYDTDTTYYIPNTCINVETGGDSPYGKFDPAYIVVTYDNDSFYYYWMSRDTSGVGIKEPTLSNDLKSSLLVTGLKTKDVKPNKSIGTRNSIMVLDASDCSTLNEGEADDFIDDGSVVTPPNKECTYNGTLTTGATFIDGQYRYMYKKEMNYGSYINMDTDGWSVALNNINSTDPVTTELCTTINGKPIVSTSFMFYMSKASSFDLTSFNTSNVVNMSGMFFAAANNATKIELKGLQFLDTSNVTNMSYIFSNFGKKSNSVNINLSRWNVEKVTNIDSIFSTTGQDSQNVNINLSGWKLNSLTYMDSIFSSTGANAKKVEVNISKWYLPGISSLGYDLGYLGSNADELIYNLTDMSFPNLTSLSSAFYMTGNNAKKVSLIGLETWDVSNVTNLSYLFNWTASNAENFSVNLSGWNVRNVTNFNSMFRITASNAKNVNINLKNWNLNPSATFRDMFAYSFGQTQSVNVDLSGWNLNHMSQIQTIFGAMNCGNTCTLNLSNWKTSGLTSTATMFGDIFMQNGKNITINVSNWDVSSVTTTNSMFYNVGNTATKVKIVGMDTWNFSSGVDYSNMFYISKNMDFGSLKIKSGKLEKMFYAANNINGTLTVLEEPTNYVSMFNSTNPSSSAVVRVNYKNTVSSIDNMIATKCPVCNVVKGNVVS